MNSVILSTLKYLLMSLPFLFFAWLDYKANLKRIYRSKQFLMPLIALVYSGLVMGLQKWISDLLVRFINFFPNWIHGVADKIAGSSNSVFRSIGNVLGNFADFLVRIIRALNLTFWISFIFSIVVLIVFIIIKRIIITIFKAAFKDGNLLYEKSVKLFYEFDTESGKRYLKSNIVQARSFLKALFIAAVGISSVLLIVSANLFRSGFMNTIFCPVYSVILVGELFFFLGGLSKKEAGSTRKVEEDSATGIANYSLLRNVLRKLFGDKLTSENTTVNTGLFNSLSNDEIIGNAEDDQCVAVEAYGIYMRQKVEEGLELDQNYFESGRELINGRSILFNDPFYYDLLPYVFFPLNHALLRHKKVLVIAGRHGIEDDIIKWCTDGFTFVTNVPTMWRVGRLTEQKQDMDVGILSRSDVHNLELHEKNDEFFSEVEHIVLVEPSKLVTTAQIGLNSVIRHCRKGGQPLVFCSMDKNCDGLVDSLSHMLLTSLSEVSATSRHRGFCSYMCWETDDEYLQHRMLPNLSRYLGVGTELSFVALKNQVSKARWYGGSAFPVIDMHWIVKQYYYDLLNYAGLPVNQGLIDECFEVSPNLWNSKTGKRDYITVEDESFNMFEIKRVFSTRATEQSFINVISTDYLLKDYMAENEGIFNADPKAIPYIVADYAHTARNVLLRLCIRLCTEMVSEKEILRELILIDIPCPVSKDLKQYLWHILCRFFRKDPEEDRYDVFGNELLVCEYDGIEYSFVSSELKTKRKYDISTGEIELKYYVSNANLKQVMTDGLTNTEYLAEDDSGERSFLGLELSGSVFQKHLPSQFFTFNGKYYEMVKVTADGKVIVRRAADHINGRPSYRQCRTYTLSNITDSSVMGDKRDIDGLVITKQFCDIRVETEAFWMMNRYNDFANAKKVVVNGIPDRVYNRKQVIRIDFPDTDRPADQTVLTTIAVMFNEVYRTLFAENQDFIVAVAPGNANIPATYSLKIEDDSCQGNCIYIIEDSKLDLGLLIAAERNIFRVLNIIFDYLDWNDSMIEKSLNPPPDTKWSSMIPPDPPENTEPDIDSGKKNKIQKFFGFVKEVFGKFFGKLFKRKKKETDPTPSVETESDVDVETVARTGEDTDGTHEAEVPATDVNSGEFDIEEPEEQSAEPVEVSETPQELQAQDDASTDESDTTPATDPREQKRRKKEEKKRKKEEAKRLRKEEKEKKKKERKKRGKKGMNGIADIEQEVSEKVDGGPEEQVPETVTEDQDNISNPSDQEQADESISSDDEESSEAEENTEHGPDSEDQDGPSVLFSTEPADPYEPTPEEISSFVSPFDKSNDQDGVDGQEKGDETEEEDKTGVSPVDVNENEGGLSDAESSLMTDNNSQPDNDSTVAESPEKGPENGYLVISSGDPAADNDPLISDESKVSVSEDTPEVIPEVIPEDIVEEAEDADHPPLVKDQEETEDLTTTVDTPLEDDDGSDDPELTGEAPKPTEEGSEEAGDATASEPSEEKQIFKDPERKPYHERAYLFFGGNRVPESLDLSKTFEYLKGLRLGSNSLKQARDNNNVAEMIEKTFDPDRRGVSHCDFCGCELIGVEYDELSDGRQRCNTCSRSAVKTQEDFDKLYRSVLDHMKVFYNFKLTVPVSIEMVNARKLHASIKKRFIPSSNQDPRVLGVAIKNKKGYSIMLENGAPRMQSAMTMVHELTHIWQYTNWDAKKISSHYGSKELQVYEGMAKWAEIQYAYLINELEIAKREEIITCHRNDEYGIGFLRYAEKYGISSTTHLKGETPFDNKDLPL